MLEISISRNVITFFEEDRPLFPLLQSEPMARQGEEDVCKGRRKRVYALSCNNLFMLSFSSIIKNTQNCSSEALNCCLKSKN